MEDVHRMPKGRLLALDLGEKRVGVAVSDEVRISVRALPHLNRSNWKKLLQDVRSLCIDFDAIGLVIGLPLTLDGNEGTAAENSRRLARNFGLSLDIPIYLHDERLTSREAEDELRAEGLTMYEVANLIDSAAAAIILRDFIATRLKGSATPDDSEASDFPQ